MYIFQFVHQLPLFPLVFSKMSLQIQMSKIMLTKCLVKDDCNRITQIQGTGLS